MEGTRTRKHRRLVDLSVPRIAFARVVREVIYELQQKDEAFRWNLDAMLILQIASEALLVDVLLDATLCANHARRKTVKIEDIHLGLRLRNKM